MDKSRETIGGMFDRIAPSYDLLNKVLSLYLDVLWRKKALKHLAVKDDEQVLDIATGTGDLALEALKTGAACRVCGLDFSEEMMRAAAAKRDRLGLRNRYLLACGDALRMPFKERSFDGAMVAFGVRNMPDVEGFFREAHRILRDGGRLAVLELSLPANPFIRECYLLYFKKFLPLIGSLLSGRSTAYHYLRDSVLDFYAPRQVEELLCNSGFTVLRSIPLSFGVCHLYLAEKPSS